MTVARKLVLALAALAVAALSAQALVQMRQEWNWYVGESEADALRLGRALTNPLAFAAQGPDGERRVRELTEAVDKAVPETQVTWQWADESPTLPAEPPQGAIAALKRGETVSWIQKHGGAASVVAVIPVMVNGRLGVVSFLDDTSLQRDHVIRTMLVLIGISFLVSLLFLVSANILGRRIIGAPVAALTRIVAAVGRGEFDVRAEPHSADELGALAAAFNGMAAQLKSAQARLERETQARLEAIDRLRHAERLVTVGKLAAGVAHELGTPMNVILGRAKLVSSGEVTGEAALKSARIIGEQIEAMMRIIRQLLDFASRKQPHRADADAVELMTQTTALLEPIAKKRGVSLEIAPTSAPVQICADPAAMQQVLNNLVVNAVHATSRGGKVTLSVVKGPATTPAGVDVQTVQLSVRDSGHGLSPEVKEHLFEPFFTTKEVGQGTGLGLAVSWGIVEDHGGWISAESEPGRGAIFTVHLPEAAA